MTAPSIKEALEQLVDALEKDYVGDVCKDEDPDEPVALGYDDGNPSALTFGMIYRAKAALATFQLAGERREAIARAITAYNEVWNAWSGIDASNVDECRTEAMKAAILASGFVQDEAGWRDDLHNAPSMSEGKYQHCDLWVVNSDLGSRRESNAFRNANGEWCDSGGNKLDWAEIEAGVLTCRSRVTHWMPLPAPPIRSARDGGAS